MARRPSGPGRPRAGESGPAEPAAPGGRAPPTRRAPRRKPAAPAAMPSKEALRRFIAGAGGRVGKTEIARHFGLGTEQRPALRALLAALKAEGSVAPAGRRGLAAPLPAKPAAPARGTRAGPPAEPPAPARRRRGAAPGSSADAPGADRPAAAHRPHPGYAGAPPRHRQARDAEGEAPPRPARDRGAPRAQAGRLPETTIVEVTGIDADGDPIARPAGWRATGQGPPPVIFMQPEARGQPALAPGQKVLARLRPLGGGKYEGRTIRRIEGGPGTAGRILGVYEAGGPGAPGRIIPTDRRSRAEWMVPAEAASGAEPGEIVLAEPLPAHRPMGPRPARVLERLGVMGEPRSVSLICIHQHGIPEIFPAEALREAERARAVTARGREDLRAIPLVTIDGEDARDFDDAVWAAPEGDGWRVLVAIADVAHYVRPGSALDREAWTRGNSVYFPDRVVPMLPEALSNGWCSLRPNENRGCLFVEMRFDRAGTKTGHRFGRGIMRSAARLTYEQVQRAAEAGSDPEGLAPGHLAALYGAFRALLGARERRGTLDLDLPERRVLLDARGHVTAVVPRPRLDSHRLIEEFMVAANVCAAEELERLGQPCMYRIHDRPSDEKLDGLRDFLEGIGITLAPSNHLQPRNFAAVLEKARGLPEERLIHETVLRSQSQAAYAPDNIGHFGLALRRYAHFTSPIRRYADLLVHRALIRGLRLGAGTLEEVEAARFTDTGEHITNTERRAAQAERDAVDRYLAAFMAQRAGEVFEARISGVTRFGLFVTVAENGASGIVPLASLPDDRWIEDQATHSLLGQRTGLRFALGQEVEARLVQATPRTGGMVFQLMTGPGAPHRAARGGPKPGRGKAGGRARDEAPRGAKTGGGPKRRKDRQRGRR